ncbi:BamA/TamA family outer membrane protein [Siphonobacter sp.]|uniref:translocation and assembly module lipoprotein TamL n=2 Tax=unclassified Siphonobacter TaxID=2635712 RepID=UPI003B3AACB5
MKYSVYKSLFALVITTLVVSCNVKKYIPEKERLYSGTEIEMLPFEGVSKKDRKALQGELAGLARPKPNSQIFGFPYRVWLYYVIGEPKKDSSFRASLRRKLGQEPVFANSRSVVTNANIWKAFLQNEGYFHSEVAGKLEEKGYKAKGIYQVRVHRRYTLDSVRFVTDTALVGKDFKLTQEKTLLKPPVPYRLDNLKLERERITQEMKRKGYYYFNPDYVAILGDTNTNNYKAKLYLALKPEMPEAAARQYYIRNVYIYPNYTLNNAVQDTNRREAFRTTAGFQVVDSSRTYDERLFHSVIGFKPGRRYNSRVQDITLSRLINLGTFKFVRNRFAPDTQGDSTVLDVHYYLTPYPKKSLRAEIAGTSKSNSLAGSQLTLSWRNRNFFKRAELLTINATGGIEAQLGAGGQGVSNFSYGLNATLTFPRLVSPIAIDYDRRQVLPKTNLTLGYQAIVRRQFYRLNSFTGSFGYAFRGSSKVEHTLIPLSLTYVYVPTNSLGDLYYEAITDPALASQYIAIVQNQQLIPSSLYTLHFNSSPQSQSRYSQQLIFNFEPAGNAAGLLFKDGNGDGQKKVFDVAFSQYVRADVDTRHYLRLTPSTTWASRVFAGAGLPYGNSSSLPFVKQYFVGGSNSIRAFRPRGIGPGRYLRPAGRTILLQDGGGDIKMEANTELRTKFNKFLQGALFVDAGNVWMYKDPTLYGETAVFSKDFLKEVAIGAGIGLRLDVTYFVLRFDLATPLRNPALAENERWVFDKINFRDRDWRKDNLILNIAVGYPF